MRLFEIPKKNEILLCFFFAITIYIIFFLTDGRNLENPESITFGFGPIIKSLINNDGYMASNILYPGGVLHDSYAHRMPLIPIWFAFFGENLKLATFLRALFFAIISIPAVRMLRDLLSNRITFYTLFPIFISPLFIRRIVDITNEESWLSIFIPCSFIGICYLKEKIDIEKNQFISIGFYISFLLGLSYLCKSSTLYLGIAVIITMLIKAYHLKELNYLNVFKLSSPLIAAIIFWNIHVFTATGHLTLGSSWDGWNILKGNNAYFSEYFPGISLDLLDYKGLIKVSSIDINTEWGIDSDLKEQAFIWISNNPIQFIKNTIHKIYIIFIDPRILPIMPWHSNYSLAIKFTSLTFFITKMTSFILLMPIFVRAKKLRNNSKFCKLISDTKHLDLYIIYLFFYFLPFVIGKYDVRHYVPFIPIIIILTGLRMKSRNTFIGNNYF
tara:strand:+ start:3771 stop:5096 length:1326 start_codon:yes stop_codon:yes gene_type:complete